MPDTLPMEAFNASILEGVTAAVMLLSLSPLDMVHHTQPPHTYSSTLPVIVSAGGIDKLKRKGFVSLITDETSLHTSQM